MANYTNYSKEDLRAFKLNPIYVLMGNLERTYGDLHHGSGKDIDKKWIENMLIYHLDLAEKLVDRKLKADAERLKKEFEEEGKEPPFPTVKVR
jgi:predicted outer membrane protein